MGGGGTKKKGQLARGRGAKCAMVIAAVITTAAATATTADGAILRVIIKTGGVKRARGIRTWVLPSP